MSNRQNLDAVSLPDPAHPPTHLSTDTDHHDLGAAMLWQPWAAVF